MKFNEAISTVASFLKDRDEAFIMSEEQTDAERCYSAEILITLLGLGTPLPFTEDPDIILNLWEGSDKTGTSAETVNFLTHERGRLELFTRARVEALLAAASLSAKAQPAAPVEGLDTIGYVHKGTAGLLMEGAVSKAIVLQKSGGDFKHPVVFADQAEAIISAERTKLEATAKAGLLLSEEIKKLKAENERLTEKAIVGEYMWTPAEMQEVVERAEKAEAKLAAIDLVLLRTASETPVPSHGGPAVSVTWELSLNGVVIESSRERYHWSERDKAGLKAPSHMQRLLVDLQAAIDSPTKPQEVADVQE